MIANTTGRIFSITRRILPLLFPLTNRFARRSASNCFFFSLILNDCHVLNSSNMFGMSCPSVSSLSSFHWKNYTAYPLRLHTINQTKSKKIPTGSRRKINMGLFPDAMTTASARITDWDTRKMFLWDCKRESWMLHSAIILSYVGFRPVILAGIPPVIRYG